MSMFSRIASDSRTISASVRAVVLEGSDITKGRLLRDRHCSQRRVRQVRMSDERHPQADRFIPYLKKVFDLGSTDRVWVDAAGEYPNLLDADTKELLGYDFCDSTTDVAVIKGSAIRAQRPEKGLVLLFDIRQHLATDPDQKYPSLTRLLLANLHSPEEKPVVALTDLVDKWYLFWMDANNIVEYNCPSSGHAIGAIDVVLNGELKDEEGKKSSLATRRKIDLPPMEGKAMPDSWKQMRSAFKSAGGRG